MVETSEIKVNVLGTCPLCGKEWNVPVPASEYAAWKSGMLIQDAIQSVPAEQREMLITGICPGCWDKYMKPLDDEDDEEIEL
jgi:hypothetical protein